MDQELDKERRQAQSDQMSSSQQVKAPGRVLAAFCLWQGNMSAVAVSLEREGAQLKNGLICLEQAYCF